MSVIGKETVYISEFVDNIGPNTDMLGPVKNGSVIVASTEPACYGPMITPEIRSGHTVTRPVTVVGAEVGDRFCSKWKNIALGGDR